MVKRKVMEDTQQPISKKKKVSVSSCEETGKIDLSNPTSVFESLLGEVKVKKFFDDHWEKKPLVCHRKDPSFYGSLFSLSTMKEVLQNNELLYLADFNVCKFKDGEKEDLNGEGRITEKDVEKLLKDKATIQFYHPQRYVDDFWSMLEKLETYFSCLVDSHVYVTPTGAQGFPLHCDDAETFVLQLEGKSEWKLYKPMVELTRDYTQDLLEENIGKPMMEMTLEPGDMLYFSRGVIYQNKTSGKEHSTHISVSTYQENTWGDFMNHAVTQAVENALENDVAIRSGLPRDYFSLMGTGKNLSQYIVDEDNEDKDKKKKDKNKYSNLQHAKVQEFKKSLEKHVSKLVDHMDINTATDAMCTHFMANRLPPFGFEAKTEEQKEAEKEKEKVMPDIKDAIKIRYPEHVRIVYAEEDEDSDDEQDEDDDDEEDEEMEEDKEEEEKPKSKGGNKKKTTTPVKNDKKKGKKSPAAKSKEENEVEDDEDIGEDEDDEEDADIPEDEPHIKVVHTLENNRFAHMGAESFDDPGYVKLDLSFAKSLIELLSADDFVTIKDIQMEEDEDKILLASTLLESDLVELKSSK